MSFCELLVKALYLCFYSGWNGRTRTANPPVNSRMLYQLSYEPISHRETHHSKNLSFHLLKINPNHLLYLFDWVCCCKRLNFQGTSYLLRNGKNTRIVAVSALIWSEWWDSNPQPRDPKSRRLPIGVHPDIWWSRRESNPRPKFLHEQNILTQ